MNGNAQAIENLPQTNGMAAGVGSKTPLDEYKEKFRQLPAATRWAIAGGIPLLMALVLMMFVWAGKTEYKVLFNNLDDQDGGAIVETLQQMQIPYKYNASGTAILVPADQVYDTRLTLASQGLPKNSVTGFEAMDEQPLGVTQFQEQVNFQRALEGELSRSIRALDSVQNARVHLAIPKPSVFVRGKQDPSASVVVTLYQGKRLTDRQVQGIIHLVSSSLPNLQPGAVSVVDQAGNLLSASGEDGIAGAKNTQLSYLAEVQATYQEQIIDILTPLFGRENVKATVSADIDFSQVERTKETYKPNADPNQATIRSQQISRSSDANAENPSGVPGVLSNTPPDAASAPIAGNPRDLRNPVEGLGSNSRSDSTVNYEVDKEVTYEKEQIGTLRNVSAAVVLNYKSIIDQKGQLREVPLTPEEMVQIDALVKKAIGFNEARGDQIEVINQPFAVSPEEAPETWKPEEIDMIKSMALPLGIALVVAILVFGLFRPLLKPALKSEDEIDDAQLIPGVPNNMPLLENSMEARELEIAEAKSEKLRVEREERLTRIRRYANDNPELVVSILRQWNSGAIGNASASNQLASELKQKQLA